MTTDVFQSMVGRRYRAIIAYAGMISIIVGLLIASPMLVFVVEWSEAVYWWAYLIPALTLIVPGLLAWRKLRPEKPPVLKLAEGAGIVVLVWAGAMLMGCLPFVFILDLSFTQAMFEATSGWTTTGLSVVDVTAAPRSILLYRSTMEAAGGAGLAILMISVMRGPAGPGLSSAEGRAEQLVPNVSASARLVVRIYLVYLAVGFVALWAAGMGWFDAVNHSLTALSTGGFSTHPESIGYWDSPLIEAVTVVLMLLGTTNFLTAYTFGRGRIREGFRDGQLRTLGVLLPVAIFVVITTATLSLYPQVEVAVRASVFQAVSALSTTGFSTVGHAEWQASGWWTLIALMLIGGGAGSTAGGIKLARIYLLYRVVVWELRHHFMPSSAVNQPYRWQGGEVRFIGDETIRRVVAFIFLYVSAYFIGVAITTAYGYSLAEAAFEMASTLSTVGLSVGVTSADAPAGLLWTQIFGMLLGRLEFFTVFVGIWGLVTDAGHLLSTRDEGAS